MEGHLAQQSSVVLVAGMHRSGTSMVGGTLVELGVDMGQRLIPADSANQRGYFEDADIVAFHGQVFRSLMPAGAVGHIDWGWAENGLLDSERLIDYREQAQALVKQRVRKGGIWGFKDPRTTVILDFWDDCIDDARFVLVYRYPWEVADSMLRGGADVFLSNPAYAYRIWTFYNTRLLKFYERNKHRCLLVSSNALPHNFEAFVQLFGSKLGVQPTSADLGDVFDARLFTGAEQVEILADLTAVAYPECFELLERLDDLADLPSDGGWRGDGVRQTEFERPDVPAEVDLSIIVPTHNDGAYLIDALASAERCRLPKTELIIVDDGSSDAATLGILAALRKRGYYVLEKPNGGLSSARNAAIAEARGSYILPLDADNRLRPHFVKAAVELLDQEPGVAVVYGDRQLFGASTELILVPDYDLSKMLGGNYVDACALFRRILWEEIGGYDEEMCGFEDWEFWIRTGSCGWRFRHLSMLALDYRVRPNSLVEQCLRGETRRKLCEHVRKKHLDLFHSHVPPYWRCSSRALSLFAKPERLTKLREAESRSFWSCLWFLVGPGGIIAKDKTRKRVLPLSTGQSGQDSGSTPLQ